MAVLLRLCDEDREKLGGPEWARFDEYDLDDQDFNTLNGYEAELGISIEFLLQIDRVAKTARWTAARVWLARKMAGVETPPWDKFNIKARKVEIKDEKPVKTRKSKAGDADPPSSSPSSEAEVSETESA